MAALRSAAPVGSAQWLLSERQQADQLVEEEAEEFTYSVRNELEWLNEHMAEIFTQSHLNVANIFKTPGKLRGKTPRTARKRGPLEARAPLTDIFAPNVQAAPTPSQRTELYNQVAKFQVAEDPNASTRPPAPALRKSPARTGVGVGKENTDSGYHGLTEDEMDVDRAQVVAHTTAVVQIPIKTLPEPRTVSPPHAEQVAPGERQSTKESFVSAKEAFGSKNSLKEDLREDDEATIPDDEMDFVVVESAKAEAEAKSKGKVVSEQFSVSSGTASVLDSMLQRTDDLPEQMDVDVDINGTRSPSEGSSPAKPLVRKSSLTFSSLPTREPLATKKSMGTRTSRTSHLDQFKPQGVGRSSQLGRFTGGKSIGGSQYTQHADKPQDEDRMEVGEDVRPELPREESETTKLHNKTSTQRLHERINMLGQAKESRPSKSIPSSNSSSQPTYPQLPTEEPDKFKIHEDVPEPPVKAGAAQETMEHAEDDDDDDWIAPIRSPGPSNNNNSRPALHKSHSADVMEQISGKSSIGGLEAGVHIPESKAPARAASPLRSGFTPGHVKSSSASAPPTKSAVELEQAHKKAISVSNPNLKSVVESTTPAGSPTGKKYLDGPLSASKAKLYSVLKSAKGIFASSAGVSAQAKMEALSPQPSRARNLTQASSSGEGSSQDNRVPAAAKQSAVPPHAPSSPEKPTEGRRTRSSSEREREEKRREKEAREHLKHAEELEKAREKERQKAATYKADNVKPVATGQPQPRLGTESRADTDGEDSPPTDDMPPPPPSKSLLPTAHAQKTREPRRLLKPVKETAAKNKPAPVSIRLASQRIGQVAPITAALSASLHESFPPPPPPKESQAQPKASSSSLRVASTTNGYKSNASSQSARPKALEAAAKKKEQEEKAAQRKAEQKRELEQKRLAKLREEQRLEQERKAAEQRLLEAKKAAQKQAAETKKLEQQRKEVMRAQSRQANDLNHALQQEKAQAPPPHARTDLAGARPMSRLNAMQEINRPTVPQMNPAKPAKRPLQADGEDEPVQRPAIQRAGPSFQQLDAKRRKTIDENEEDDEPRRSVMAPPIRHSNIRKEPTKFPHGYTTAPTPAAHTTSMFKATVTAQHQLQHSKPAHPNDMAKFSSAKIPFAEAPNPPAHPSHKTPARALPPAAVAKSSPHYPPSENIALPEIATDSEDEDSEHEFAVPDWAASPALRELLAQQQLVDPEQIFGPIAPLQMEEIFKNKDRQKKFRDRTSSANWSGADRLTEEERRRDREARERLMREGGWTFQGGA